MGGGRAEAVGSAPARFNVSTVPPHPLQPAVAGRKEGRFVSLPDELDLLEPIPPLDVALSAELPPVAVPPATGYVEAGAPVTPPPEGAAPVPTSLSDRVAIYCLGDAFDMKVLTDALEARGAPHVTHRYEEAVAGAAVDTRGSGRALGFCVYYEYGVVVFWGLTRELEDDICTTVAPAVENPLPPQKIEVDEFTFIYAPPGVRPSIANDVVTLPHRHAADHAIKYSLSFALAQSTKLSVYEERVIHLVDNTRDLPQTLADTGDVNMSRTGVARLIGRVFLERASVNLLMNILDTPSYFWSAPDALQVLYKRCYDYLDMEERVQTINLRYQVLSDLLQIARSVQESKHSVRLEWVVIWLILIEVVIGVTTILLGAH